MDTMGYELEVEGQPTIKTTIQLLPPPDSSSRHSPIMVLGMIISAMPAVNPIPARGRSTPGIATYKELPLTVPRGFAKRC